MTEGTPPLGLPIWDNQGWWEDFPKLLQEQSYIGTRLDRLKVVLFEDKLRLSTKFLVLTVKRSKRKCKKSGVRTEPCSKNHEHKVVG